VRAAVVTALAAVLGAGAAVAAVDPKDPTKRLRPADMRTARSIALRLSDLPAGWRQVKSQPPTPCSTQPDLSRFIETADVDPTFESADGSISIDSEVELFATPATARGVWRALTLATERACANETVRKQLGKSARLDVRAAPLPAVRAPRRFALYGVLHATSQGQRVTVASELLAFGSGRTTVYLTWYGPPGSVQRRDVQPLLALLAKRLARA
jgi:hypothetical protein